MTVTCDQCEEGLEVQITATASGWDERDLTEEIESRGWMVRDSKDVCPQCVEDGPWPHMEADMEEMDA